MNSNFKGFNYDFLYAAEVTFTRTCLQLITMTCYMLILSQNTCLCFTHILANHLSN